MEENIDNIFPFITKQGNYYNIGRKDDSENMGLSILELKRLQLKIAKIIYDEEK